MTGIEPSRMAIISQWMARSKNPPKTLEESREAQIEFMTRANPDYTRDTAKAELEFSDRLQMELRMMGSAGARSERTFVKILNPGTATGVTYDITANQMVSPNLTALDVKTVMANKDAFAYRGFDAEKTIAYYIEATQAAAERSVDKNGYVNFTGTWDKSRVTHDVNEYIGWLYEAAGMQQTAAASGAPEGAAPANPQPAPVTAETLGGLKNDVLNALANDPA